VYGFAMKRLLDEARQFFGSGGLEEDEAFEIALEAVRAVRANSIRIIEAPAPVRFGHLKLKKIGDAAHKSKNGTDRSETDSAS
jgi:hypothetical protein